MAIALIIGRVFDRLVASKVLPADHNAVALPENFQFWREAETSIKSICFNMTFWEDVAIS